VILIYPAGFFLKETASMISPVSSTVSALQAYNSQLEVTSNNIANVNTDEFKKSKATLKEGANGGVQVDIRRVDTPGHRYQELAGDQMVEKESSNVDLTEELPQMMVTQHAYQANMKVIQTQDEILGTALNIMG
jgi:flagellar hook protein FlgE